MGSDEGQDASFEFDLGVQIVSPAPDFPFSNGPQHRGRFGGVGPRYGTFASS
jgi:hypothetical protein